MSVPARKATGLRKSTATRKPAAFSMRISGIAMQVEQGLPVATLDRVAKRLGVDSVTVRRLTKISATTFARRNLQGRFSAEESDRLHRLQRISDRVIEFFNGDTSAAQRWLERPATAFGGVRPLDMLINDAGVQEVDALLGRLDHGVFT